MDYRYHCYIPAENGRNTLPFNPCQLLDFTLLRLEAGADLVGRVRRPGDPRRRARRHGPPSPSARTVRGGRRAADVFSGKPHSVYIPAGTTVTDRGARPVEIAMPSAPSDLAVEPYVIGPDQVATGRWGAANFGRDYHQILTEIAQPDLPAAAADRRRDVHAVRQLEHVPAAPAQGRQPAGRGAARGDVLLPRQARATASASAACTPTRATRRTSPSASTRMQMMPEGYHTVVSAPGYTTYYLWFLAGTQRTQGALEDADARLGRPNRADAARPRALSR